MSNNHQPEISVVCPDCGTARKFSPPAGFQPNSEGLTTLNIPLGAVCKHSFQILVDKNSIVRGYNKADFEILTEPDNLMKETEVPLSKMFDKLTSKTAALLIEALFTFTPTIIVGVDNDFIPNLTQFYHDLFPHSKDFITILNLAEYNRIWKNRIYSSEYINSFVIDVMKGIIIKSNIKATKFSETILREIMGEKTDSVGKVVLKNWIDRITKYMDVTEKLVRKQPGIKKKEIIKYLTRLHEYNPKLVPFDIIIKRLIHIDESIFRPYL